MPVTPLAEDPLFDLRCAAEAPKDTLTRLSALSAFFTACEEGLSTEDTSSHYHAFAEATFLLGSRIADGVVWDWFQEQARIAATPERREQLRIALFELAPDHPIIWSDLFRLWDFWFDPPARWALYSAYWWFPRRLRSHLARYTAHRRRRRLPVPEFSHDEFHAWLQTARA